MIGTTVKVGFDSSAVGRGMANIGRMMGRGIGRMGIGALERVGHRVTDLMGRIVMAIPEAIKETSEWAANLTDMSSGIKMSVEEIVLLEEKLRLAGASASDTSRMIFILNKSVHDATSENGAAAESLRKLGFMMDEFVGLTPDQAFNKIGMRVAELGPEFQGLEEIMAQIFGGRMGHKLIRFFNSFEASSERARKNVAGFAKELGGGLAARIDEFDDAMGRFQTIKRQLSTMFLENLFRVTGGSGGADKMFDALDPEKLRPKITELFNMIGRNLEVFMSQDLSSLFGDVFRNIGRQLGEGIKESLKGSLSIKTLMPFLSGGGQSTSGDPIAVLKESNKLLTEIRDKSVAKFS
jgi:hypothetical protein